MADVRGATNRVRYAACRLVDRKLVGQKRKEATLFIRRQAKDNEQIQRLMERLDLLPDVVRECHPSAILTDKAILEIREAAQNGVGLIPLGRKYGVDPSTISRAVRGVTHKDVGGAIKE